MANKALAKRQKMTMRAKPAPRSLKPRNPFAVPAGQRSAGAHRRSASSIRQEEKQDLKKQLPDQEE